MPSASHQTSTNSVVHHAVPALQSTNTKHPTDDENDNYSQASYVCEFNNKSSKWECVKSDYKSVVLQQVMVSIIAMCCVVYVMYMIFYLCGNDMIPNKTFCAHLVYLSPSTSRINTKTRMDHVQLSIN